MARVEINWNTSHSPIVNKNELARQEAAKQKEREQTAADAEFAAKLKEAVEQAGEEFKAQKATELERSLQEYRATQEPGYAPAEMCMHPDGIQRPFRRRTAADVVADAEAALQNNK